MKPGDLRGVLVTALILCLGLAGLGSLQNRIEKNNAPVEAAQTLLYIPDHRVLQALALGDDACAAAILWVRSVFYIAANDLDDKQDAVYKDIRTKASGPQDSARTTDPIQLDYHQNPALQSLLFWNLNSNDLSQLLTLTETVTDLDPYFVTPYIHGAMSLGLFAGRYNEALRLLDKGVKNCPNDWEPLYYRGFLKLFYLNDRIGAAADVTEAAKKPKAPTIVIQLAAALTVGVGEVDQALTFLTSLREVSGDDQLKSKIDDMLMVYGSRTKVDLSPKVNDVGRKLDAILQQSSTGR